jgi:hypothetical protein
MYIQKVMNYKDITSFVGLTKKQAEPIETDTVVPVVDPKSYGEKLIELTWKSPTRTVSQLPEKTVRTLIVVAVAISLIFALMQEFMPIAVIACAGFLAYMLSKSPAEEVEHQVSTHGLLYAGEQFYYWHELKHFFFKNEPNSNIMCVDTIQRLPGRIFMGINEGDKEKLKEIFSKRILFLTDEPKDLMDKFYASAVSKFSLSK